MGWRLQDYPRHSGLADTATAGAAMTSTPRDITLCLLSPALCTRVGARGSGGRSLAHHRTPVTPLLEVRPSPCDCASGQSNWMRKPVLRDHPVDRGLAQACPVNHIRHPEQERPAARSGLLRIVLERRCHRSLLGHRVYRTIDRKQGTFDDDFCRKIIDRWHLLAQLRGCQREHANRPTPRREWRR